MLVIPCSWYRVSVMFRTKLPLFYSTPSFYKGQRGFQLWLFLGFETMNCYQLVNNAGLLLFFCSCDRQKGNLNIWISLAPKKLPCNYLSTIYVKIEISSNISDVIIHNNGGWTILTWKNFCLIEKIHWNTRLAASKVFHFFTKTIKLF